MNNDQIELKKEQIAQYKEAFSFFDKSGVGQINTSDISILVRSLNLNPTEDEIIEIQMEADPDGTGKVEFPDFLTAVARRDVKIDYENEIFEAFHAMQSSENKIDTVDVNLIKEIVISGNDAFTDEEYQTMLKILKLKSDDAIAIADFVRLVQASMELDQQK